MTTFTTLSDSTLSQDKPLTQDIARAWRDNPLAIAEGDASAPRISVKAIDSRYISVARTTDQSFTANAGVAAKVQLNSEIYDPDNLFDSTTNYRFTPNVPGLYMVCADTTCASGQQTGSNGLYAILYKNGTFLVGGSPVQATNGGRSTAFVNTFVPMNGTSDYLELWVAQGLTNGTAWVIRANLVAVCLCEA